MLLLTPIIVAVSLTPGLCVQRSRRDASLVPPSLNDRYLPPPPERHYLPPPPSDKYLPPDPKPPTQEYLPPPQKEYLPPPEKESLPPPPEKEYLPPPPVKEYLPPPPEQEYLPPPPEKEYLPPLVTKENLPPPSDSYLPPLQNFYLPPPEAVSYIPETPLAEGGEGKGEMAGSVFPSSPDDMIFVEGGAYVITEENGKVSEPVVVDETTEPHEGFCPRPKRGHLCTFVKAAITRNVHCFTDADCTQDHKCCANDCQLQCVPAVKSPKSCDDVVCAAENEDCVDLESGPYCQPHTKQGSCPYFGQFCSNRINKCEDDEDCEGDKLCCNLGCHRLCVDPVTRQKHDGICPAALSRPPTRCSVSCLSDEDCADREKCCDTACGSTCMLGEIPFITCENRNCPPGTRCVMEGLNANCLDIIGRQ